VGSCGVRAVLCEQRRRQCYPLQWLNDRGELVSELPLAFRWQVEPPLSQGLMPVVAAPREVASYLTSVQELEVDRFKAFLLDPTLQGSDSTMPLQVQLWGELGRLPRFGLGVTPNITAQLAAGLGAIFQRLSPDFLEAFPGRCQHPLLTTEEVPQILRQLTGVILSCPANAPVSYRSVLRDGVLQSRLVDLPSRVVFLEDSIAALFSHAPLPSGQILVIHGSYSRTELALLSLPQGSTAAQGILGFNGGQMALTQAIIGQLLYPLLPQSDRSPLETFHLPEIPDFLNLSEPLESSPPGTIGSVDSHPSLHYHQHLQWHLQQSPLGNILLQAAERLQGALQQQEQFTLRIGQQNHILSAQQWQTQIVQPYHHKLHHTLQTLLHRTQLSTQSIDYILGTGRLGCQPWVLQGLQSRCPQAKIIETGAEEPSQLALGLAQFPVYGIPTVLS